MKSRDIFLVILLAAVLAGWFFRWQTIPITGGCVECQPQGYVMNRWTGEILFITQGQKIVVVPYGQARI